MECVSLLNKIAKNKLPKANETLARIDYDVNDDPRNVDVVGHDETITIKYNWKKHNNTNCNFQRRSDCNSQRIESL